MKKYILKKINKGIKEDYKIDYEDKLNSAQLEVVIQKKGPMLVIAGAGSGKTRTLVYRAIRLIEDGINPENILLLTFTRKAAGEMLRRASRVLDERCSNISGGTFHSFANMILRRYAKLIGFASNFSILDRKDAEDVIGFVRTDMGFHKSKERFPNKETISDVISKAVNKDCPVGRILKEGYPHFAENSKDIIKIQKEYSSYKKNRSIMDYDDLLLYLEKLLSANDDIRSKLSNFYRYIMIDEFQDTNKLQARIAYSLASNHQNIMVVGDDSQSIYSFRGANFKNIMDFPKKYKDAQIIKLEQNYRSTQPILDFTNEIIRFAKESYRKTLFTNKEGEQKPVYIESQDDNYQSKFIVQRILELREEGVSLSDIAVLFRSSWHSMDLEIELMSHNIPFVKYGGLKFTEAAHIKDILAYLKVAYNPMDSVSWHRILLLIEGIGPQTTSNLVGGIVDDGKGIEYLNESSYSSRKYSGDLEKLYLILRMISGTKSPLSDKVKAVIGIYDPIMKEKYDDFNKRVNDVNSLEIIAQRYKELEDFLVDLTLEPLDERQTRTEPEDKDEDKLILSTIHSAKGLEWHTVFIISLIDGYIPSTYALFTAEEIEEERRLLYVAATRAKQNLYLVKPDIKSVGGNYYERTYQKLTEVSRFLSDGKILDDFVEKWSLTDE
jgi:DNA helicase II / ATP-dependent DNA helicase PcrA